MEESETSDVRREKGETKETGHKGDSSLQYPLSPVPYVSHLTSHVSLKKGFPLFSYPIVVLSPWPG
ncbi:hypothetical protein GCM10027036_19430 [Flavihumibacter cheonanensis]